MIIYVEVTHTVPIEVDEDRYDENGATREQLARQAARDPDLMEDFGNGPHDVHDIDWEVVTDLDHMARLDEMHVFHTYSAEVKRR